MRTTYVISTLIACALAPQVFAGTISVTGFNSTVTPTVETLTEGINVYHDRSPGHRLVNIPPEFENDALVVVTSNSDKTKSDFSLELTASRLGILYVALDTRHRASQPLAWMQDKSMTGLPAIFFDTGRTIDIDEGSTLDNAGDSIDQTFNLWATIAPPGTYNFFEQTYGGGSNNYLVLYDDKLVPEPGSCLIVLLGMAGIAARIRGRR